MRKSLRDSFPAVEKIPSEIIDLCRTLRDGNTKRLLSLLIEHPKEITVGVYDCQNRIVRCKKELFSWRSSQLTREVPIYMIHSGIASVNQSLSIRKLPYRAWYSCPGLPWRVKLVQLREKVKPSSTTPFVMGLVKIA